GQSRAPTRLPLHDALPIFTADGRLTLVHETRRELDTLAAWPVLEASGFDDDDFAECVKLSLSKVEKRVAQKSGRGKGKAAIQELDRKSTRLNSSHVKISYA